MAAASKRTGAAQKRAGATRKPLRARGAAGAANHAGVFAAAVAGLPAAQKRALAVQYVRRQKLGRFVNRGFYAPVFGPDQLNRRWTTAETGDALAALPASERNRLIALARNTARNSEHLEAVLHQLEVNVVGTEGGRAIFSFPAGYEKAQSRIHAAFAAWAQEAEFFDDQNLQSLLRLILRTLYLGGDLALVYDFGIVRDTGKIIAFDPDCIGNISEVEFKAAFGKEYTQHQGILKNRWGQTCGLICSMRQRGLSEFRLWNPDGTRAAWTLVKPAGVNWTDCPFTLIRDLRQINGMRGASALWPGLGSLSDQADLQGYEIQSAKRSAQIVGQVLQDETATNEAEIAAEMDPAAIAPELGLGDAPAADGGNGEALAEALAQESLTLERLGGAAGAIYDVMPEGCKFEQIDPNRGHPNTNVTEFSRWLNGGAAWAAGLSKLYSCGESTASYSASMAEMILANSSFRVEFHRLECGFLDWALANWAKRAQARGEIPPDGELPADWRRTCVKWQQPRERALNPVDDANATTISLRNLTTSYHDKLGADWKEKLAAIADEIRWTRENGIPDPRLQTASGAVISTDQKETSKNEDL